MKAYKLEDMSEQQLENARINKNVCDCCEKPLTFVNIVERKRNRKWKPILLYACKTEGCIYSTA